MPQGSSCIPDILVMSFLPSLDSRGQFPFDKANCLCWHSASFFAHWFPSMKSPKRSGGSPNFQFNRIIAVVDVFLFCKQSALEKKSPKTQGQKAKAWLMVSQALIRREPAPTSTPWVKSPRILAIGKNTIDSHWLTAHSSSCRTLPSSARHYHPAGTMTVPSKGHSTILSGQLLQGNREYCKIGEYHEYEPITTALAIKWVPCSEVILYSMTADKAFCKSTYNCFGIIIVSRKSKTIPKEGMYSRKNKVLPFHDGSAVPSTITDLSPGGWLISHKAYTNQGLAVDFCFWHIRHSAVAMAKSVLVNKVHILRPCVTFIPDITPHCPWATWSRKGGWGKGLSDLHNESSCLPDY